MTEKTMESDKGENTISPRTTPTWEMELLVSGATVFSLLQLPGPISRAAAILMNSNDQNIAILVSIVSIYVYVSLVALIGAFILHLIARGYWVAIVGLNSVYPEGIKWGKGNSSGPIHRAVVEESQSSMQQLIERADNRATGIFGLGFGLAISLVIPIVIIGSMLLVLVVVQFFGLDVALWH